MKSIVQFYGSLQPADLIQQFAKAQTNISAKKPYDAPLWIVYVDGKFLSAYPDQLLQLLKTSQGDVEPNVTSVSEALDELHAIAQRTGIVTPYSSMIVLVDERQREALRQAEEPSQVLGLMVCAIALVLLKRKPARA